MEFRGIKIGQVLDMKLEADPQTMEVRIPVLIEIEPDRIAYTGTRPSEHGAEAQQRSARRCGCRADAPDRRTGP